MAQTDNKKDDKSVITSYVLKPRWSYIHLSPSPTSTPSSTSTSSKSETSTPDATTVRLQLLRAMSAYLGDTGAAIPVDILHIAPTISDNSSQNASNSLASRTSRHKVDIIIRVPVEDSSKVVAAVGGNGGFVVRGVAGSLNQVAHGDGSDLFEFVADSKSAPDRAIVSDAMDQTA